MNIVPWDPWEELERIRAETDRLWDAFFAKLPVEPALARHIDFLPDVDIVETDYDTRLFLAVPGLVEDDLEIEATTEALVVRGERQPPYDPQRQHLREWRYGYFERRVSLSEPIDVDKVQATYDAGVLTVVLPKVAQAGGE